MKILPLILIVGLSLVPLSASALTVQAGDYQHTFSDPTLRQDANDDWQDDREDTENSNDRQDAQNIQDNMSHREETTGRR